MVFGTPSTGFHVLEQDFANGERPISADDDESVNPHFRDS